MKGKTAHISTKIFNPRLFLEGLKRLRVIGLATAILALTASALVPIVIWMELADREYTYVQNTEFLCVPAGLLTLLAPFFFFVLFSFLQKRKESDFFHAIPYTRTCVYVSFTVAALAFIFAIQLACGLLAGILWSMIPGLFFELSGLISYVLISMLAAAMLCSFMMLALSVSGTAGSCMLLFLLFTGFTRVVAAIFLGCMDSIDLLPVDAMWETSFFSPTWLLPITVLYYFIDIETAASVMYSLPQILYSIVVTLGVFALAGLIYKHRRSEMAGNPAPGTRTQALFRILFTLIPALLLPLLIITGSGDAAFVLVLVAGILLVYFLYELITTKRPKNMLRAIPGLGLVAAGCILFTLLFYGYRAVILYEDIEAEEIKTVSVESNGFGAHTYQGCVINEFNTNDPEIVDLVADQLAYSQARERNISSYEGYWNRTTVTIRLRSGRTIERYIILTEEHLDQLMDRFRELDEVREILYQLPSDKEIESSGASITISPSYMDHCYMNNSESGNMEEFMVIFRSEFNTLTDEQKDAVMAPTLHYLDWEEHGTGLTLSLRGNTKNQRYISEYCITEAMPRTRAYLLTWWNLETYNYYDPGDYNWSGEASDVLLPFLTDLENGKFRDVHETVMLSLHAVRVSELGEENGYCENDYIRISTDDLSELIGLLLEQDLMREKAARRDPFKAITLTDDTYCLHLTLEGDHENYSRLYMDVSGLFNLTDEDWRTISDILDIQNPVK